MDSMKSRRMVIPQLAADALARRKSESGISMVVFTFGRYP